MSANYASMGMWHDSMRRIPFIGCFLVEIRGAGPCRGGGVHTLHGCVNPCAEQCNIGAGFTSSRHPPKNTITNLAHRQYIDPYDKSLTINRRFSIIRRRFENFLPHVLISINEKIDPFNDYYGRHSSHAMEQIMTTDVH